MAPRARRRDLLSNGSAALLRLRSAKFTPDVADCILLAVEFPFKLRILHCTEDLAKDRPGFVAHCQQIVPSQQTSRPDLLFRAFCEHATHKSIRVQPSMTRTTVEPMQLQMFVKPRLADEPLQRGSPHLFDVFKLHVVRH